MNENQHRREPDLPEHGLVEDFFARERSTIEELPGHDLHWQGIARRGSTPGRRRGVAWVAAGAAAALVGAAGVAIWQGQGASGDLDPAGQPSSTVSVPSPEDTTATSPDGSATAPASGFVARSLSSGDASTRAVLGTDSCEGTPCASIQVTTDDGATWAPVTAPDGVTPAPTDGVVANAATGADQVGILRMADPQTMWVAGSSIQRTVDGGQSWANYPYPGGTVIAMEVDSGTIRFVTAEGCTSDGCSGPLKVYRAGTDDTLAEVQTLRVDVDEITDVDLVTSGDLAFLAVDHGDGHSVYRLGEDAEQIEVCGGDGGVSLGVPAIASGGVLTAICEKPVDRGTEIRTTRSTDQGQTWSEPTEPTLVTRGTVSLAQPDVGTLVVATSTRDGEGTVYRSVDAGASWSELSLPAGIIEPWTWVGAAGQGRIYAIPAGASSYVESLDGGESWRAVPLD